MSTFIHLPSLHSNTKALPFLRVTALITLLLFSIACSLGVSAQKSSGSPVNIVEVKMRTLTPLTWVTGTVISRNDAKLAAEISGRLVQVAAIGARIKQGDTIAKIDDKQLLIQQKVDQARLVNAQTQLTYLDAELRRKNSLVKQKLSPSTEADKALSERDIAKGDVLTARANLAKTQQNLVYTALTAPFDGIVAERITHLGEYVSQGNSIVRFVESSHNEAAIFVPIVSSTFINKDQSIAIQSPLGKALAPIKAIIPVANSQSHLMEVRLDLSLIDWPVGLQIKAHMASDESKTILSVPRDALVLRRTGSSIFKINTTEDSSYIAEKVQVSTSISSGDFIGITSSGAIKSGDLVVIRGAERLRSGQAVTIKDNNDILVSGTDK
jgi:RND family efflux transporter MFP subunit